MPTKPTKAKTDKRITPQKVWAVLAAQNMRPAGRYKVREYGIRRGLLIVEYKGKVDRDTAIGLVAVAMSAAGIAVEVRNGAVLVAVDQGQGQPAEDT